MLFNSSFSKNKWLEICSISFVSIILLFVSMKINVNNYDEGVILTGAYRIAAGHMIHRDFYCTYGPAQFYILAGLFKLFSASILVERVWDTIIRTAIVVFVYLIIKKRASPKIALCSSLVALVWLSSFGYYGYPVFPALLFSLISYYSLLSFIDVSHKSWSIFISGVASGLVTLFRYDIGLVVCIVNSVVLVGYLLTIDRSGEKVAAIRNIVVFLGGILIISFPLVAVYIFSDNVKYFYHDIVSYPSINYYPMRSLPFPSMLIDYNVLLCLPPLAWMISLPCAVGAWRKGERSFTWMVVTLMLLSVAFYCKGLVRVSIIHMSLAIIPSLVLFAMVFRESFYVNCFTRVAVVFCLCASLYVTGYMLSDKILSRYTTLGWQTASSLLRPYKSVNSTSPMLDRLNFFSIDKSSIYAIQYIRKHTVSGERIYSGTGRHDKIFANNVIFYFLADRLPATKWHHFDPGLQNSKSIQSSMIEEFKSVRPRYLVLDSTWDRKAEPNKSSVSSGVTLLDSYITHTYRNVATFGNVKVMQRI